MRNKHAFLIEVCTEDGELKFRRIALNLFDADDWIEEFSHKYVGSMVHENIDGVSGVIASESVCFSYKYTAISIV